MRARPDILLLVFSAIGCVREEAVSDGTTAAPAATSGSSEQDLTPSPSARVGEGYPMPGPERRRLEAAVALNATCVSCHPDEAAEWRRSRHRQSNTNAAYQAAFAVEPSPFCRGCH